MTEAFHERPNGRLNGQFNGRGPRIALPEPTSTDTAYNQRAWAPYFHALASCGAVGVPIPLDASAATVAKLVASCDGVLLPGSPADVDPQRYGATARPETAQADPARETVDWLLLDHAFQLRKPVFGVCYGIQTLNVWRGGTLAQHLPLLTKVDHDPEPAALSAHSIRITVESKLASILGKPDDLVSITEKSATVVNSSHHQAIDRPGDGLAVSARCVEDGVIEAVELTGKDRDGAEEHFVVGVQWHPERSFDSSEASWRLFHAFVDAAARHHAREMAESLAL
jgi:putative glutamine amidotransferase